jgi:hypothetical protein
MKSILPSWPLGQTRNISANSSDLPGKSSTVLDELHLLVVRELMSCQEPGLQLRKGVTGQGHLHEVGHKVEGGLQQGCEHVVVADELVVNAPQDELPLGHGEPGDGIVGPEEQQHDVLVVCRRRRWWRFGDLHIGVGCVLCVGRSPLVGIKHYN